MSLIGRQQADQLISNSLPSNLAAQSRRGRGAPRPPPQGIRR